MKDFFKELFEYHHHFNQKLIGEIKNHEAVLPERTFPLLCHILNAHQIWNARVLNHEPFTVWQVNPLEACPAIDDLNYKNSSQILETRDLAEIIHYQTFRGDSFSNTLRDILFHVINHTTHHRGQVISDFRSVDIEPITTDYIFYKR